MEQRKTYVKPAISSVDLIPEEAVLGVCKTAGTTELGPDGSGCVAVVGQCPTDIS